MAKPKFTAASLPPLNGKMILITGANSGIGYTAAVELARHGAEVLMGARNAMKGEEALRRLKKAVPGAKAHVAPLDLASLASIHAFVGGFTGELDVLVNNAGVMALPTRELTADGFERQFGTNHLGHFALTALLVPALRRSPDPRVVTVSSLAHRNGSIDFGNLQSERKYVPWDAYAASKLANLLFALELDRRARAEGSNLLSIPVHPGVSTTSLFENGPGRHDLKARAVTLLAPFFFQNDEAGALPTLYAAGSPDAKSGEYLGPDGFYAFKGSPTVEQPRPQALDEQVAKELWAVSEQLTGVAFPPLI